MILVSFPRGKTSGNLFNPRINVPIREKSGNLFNDPRINRSAQPKKSGNLFNDLRINLPTDKSLETYIIILISMCLY